MYNILKNNKLLFITYLVILMAGLIPVLMHSKADIHLFINQFHTSCGDIFFKYVTIIGSGFAAVVVSIILLFISIRYSLIMFTSWAITGILVQFLKHVVFPDLERPVRYFKTIAELHLVHGVELYKYFTFPSGHAATAFVIFTMLALISKKIRMKLFLLLSAVIIAFSRVYLSQHFLEDILFGSLLGCIAVIIFYWYFHLLKIPWSDKPLQYYLRSER